MTSPAGLLDRSNQTSKYRPEIDGLRAIAVASVLLYHAGFSLTQGGFVGVDVFFVISGYLITGIIQSEIESGTFTFSGFYERRARRILPALIVVVAASGTAAWYWLLPSELVLFAKSAIGALLSVSNIVFWQELNYFLPASEEMPLLHTWSLGIEEQFYLFLPVFLIICWRIRPKLWPWLVLVGTILSFLLAELLVERSPAAAFYLIPTRAWELGIGALCAVVAARMKPVPSNLLALVGMSGIFVSVYALNGTVPFPSAYALLPTLSTALLILYSSQVAGPGRWLAVAPVVKIGLISYSAYLWHQPLFAFARIRSPVPLDTFQVWILIAVTFALAWVTWRFVEVPFRRRGQGANVSTAGLVFGLGAVMVMLVAWMTHTIIGAGIPGRLSTTTQRLLLDPAAEHSSVTKCRWGGGQDARTAIERCSGGGSPNDVLVIGDSHAQTLIQSLRSELPEEEVGMSGIYAAGCLPIRGLYRIDGRATTCPYFIDSALKAADERGIGTLVLVGRWALGFEGEMYDNGEGGVEAGTFAPVDTKPGRTHRFPTKDDGARKDRVGRAIHAELLKLLDQGYSIVWVDSVPEPGWNVPKRAARAVHFGWDNVVWTTSAENHRKRNTGIDSYIAVLKHPRFFRFSPSEHLCRQQSEVDRCDLRRGGELLYSDDNHLSRAGARVIAAPLAALVKRVVAEREVNQDEG